MWARLEDNFPQHPKILSAGPLAELLQVRAICYAARNLTDGVIPAGVVPVLLTGFGHVGLTTAGVPGMFIQGVDAHEIDWPKRMLAAGLWDAHKNGRDYIVHDYLRYNPSKRQYLQDRRKKSKAGRAGGQASAQARAQAHAQAKSNPVPVPVPVPELQETTQSLRTVSGGRNGHPDLPRQILEFLNAKTGRHYRPVKTNLALIAARLREGITEVQLRAIVLRKIATWQGDPKMDEYLRPATLFNRTNCEQYRGELPP